MRKLTGSIPQNNNDGYTLLELMIAIVLVGFIVVIMAGAMRLGYRSVERGDRKIESLERFRSSLVIIDAQIQSAIPIMVNSTGLEEKPAGDKGEQGDKLGSKEYYFEGSNEALTLTTNYSIWGGQSGHVLVEYRVETDENGLKSLAVKEQMVGKENGQETVLFKGASNITFEYFYHDPTEEKGKWVEEWTDTASTPQKIRFHLVSGKTDVTLIIPMRVYGGVVTS